VREVRARLAVLAASCVVLGVTGCGRSTASGATPPPDGLAGGRSAADAAGSGHPPAASEGPTPLEPLEVEEWARANAGDEDALLRLVDHIGCDGVRDRARDPSLRTAALRAMGRCPDFSELPWLADVATSGSEADATEALGAIVDQAARPRRATDPEDAEELSEGCAKLLALARATGSPRARRVSAIRALRMLAERGCVKRTDIPADLDARSAPDAAK
jgi:hypothetical protein